VLAAVTVAALSATGVVGWTLLDSGGGSYWRGQVRILTGGTQGVYYGYGVKLAQAINSRLDGVTASAIPTTASVENLLRVAEAPNVLAFAAADAASAAVAGRPPFGRAEPVRALARVYDDYIHLVVRKESGISKISELRGRRVSIGAKDSGTELIAGRLLMAGGVTPADVKVSRLGINESVSALRAGTIDAFFWSGGLPTSGVARLAAELPIRLVRLDTLADKLHNVDAAYRRGTIPQGTYAGVPETPTIAVPDLLVTRADSDPDLVRQVTRILFDARPQLAREVLVADALDRRTAIATAPIPLHDGALRYYRETKL
jgi:uncharacterized protein